MRYIFIREHREVFPVGVMCRVLEVGRSGFYTWLNRPESPRSSENRRLIVEIKAIHQESRQTYGSPRVHADLKDKGYTIGKHPPFSPGKDKKEYARRQKKPKDPSICIRYLPSGLEHG